MLDDDLETYILLLLSDSNLPTGSFVASAGLESYLKHGFPAPPKSSVSENIINYVRDSLASYANSALPFVSDAHRSVEMLLLGNSGDEGDEEKLNGVLCILTELDDLYQTMTLNHVTRRASTAQGVALLTLYSKGFSRSTWITAFPGLRSPRHEDQMATLVEALKVKIRREEIPGHLPICWGILTAALGLRLGMLFVKIQSTAMLTNSVRPCSVPSFISSRSGSSLSGRAAKRDRSV